jgi:hypothetical protein
MKVYRSQGFDSANPIIWSTKVFKFRNGKGPIFVAKALLLGFDTGDKTIELGPFVIRPYKKGDKPLGTWGSSCCVVELKFQDQEVNPPQATPVSMYVEPYWLIHAFFQSLQLYIDTWVGMGMIHYFDKNEQDVSTFGSYLTSLADSWHPTPRRTISTVNKNKILTLIKAQTGSCNLAIDRYSKGLTGIVDDAVLDFVIVFENLLGFKLKSEISHRLCTRGALLLAKNKLERVDYYNSLRFLYDLRSDIVHGEIDEISAPTKKKYVDSLMKLGVNLESNRFNDRYHIAEFARKIARMVLIYFINNEKNLDTVWLSNLELGV